MCLGHRFSSTSLLGQASIALHSTLRTRLPANRTLHFPAEFCILVLPLLLSVTLLADSPALLIAILLIPTGILLLVPPREVGTPLPSSHTPSRASSPSRGRDHHEAPDTEPSADRQSTVTVPPLAALTTYRAHMLLLTAICILAVDFRVFPRSLAKCETFGVSIVSQTCRLFTRAANCQRDGSGRRIVYVFPRRRVCDTAHQEPEIHRSSIGFQTSGRHEEMRTPSNLGPTSYTFR